MTINVLLIIMKKHENIDDWEFNYHLNRIADLDKETIISDCIASLNKCDYERKIKCIAWISA